MQDRWELATDDTAITIQASPDQVVVSRLQSREGAHQWLGRPYAVPLLTRVGASGHELAPQWRFEHGAFTEHTGELVLSFTSAHPRLALRSIWRARPGHGPIEHWCEVENLSGASVTLFHLDSLRLHGLRPGAPAELWWIKRGGGNASTQGGTFTVPLAAGLDLLLTSNCEDGASPVPWMAVQVGGDRGLYVGWEFSGLGRIQAKAGEDADTLDIEIGASPDFKTDLAPGEVFLVPPAFVGCYAGDVDEGS